MIATIIIFTTISRFDDSIKDFQSGHSISALRCNVGNMELTIFICQTMTAVQCNIPRLHSYTGHIRATLGT